MIGPDENAAWAGDPERMLKRSAMEAIEAAGGMAALQMASERAWDEAEEKLKERFPFIDPEHLNDIQSAALDILSASYRLTQILCKNEADVNDAIAIVKEVNELNNPFNKEGGES